MKNTKIEWTDHTWNPLRGCSRVSEGCRNCYAEQVASRFSGPGMPYEGLINKTAKGPTWNGSIKLVPEKLSEPLRWSKPRMIFVNSMSDLFHENVPDEYIDQVFAVMARARRHTFQVLTKRPERMRAYLSDIDLEDRLTDLWRRGYPENETWNIRLPLSNVWLGVSVENQETANERIPLLLETPAAVRWISAEPLLGPVSFRWANWHDYKRLGAHHHLDGMKGIDWVVVGGESGPNARPMHPDWARALRAQCHAAGVPFLFKQWGEWISDDFNTVMSNGAAPNRSWVRADGHGFYFHAPYIQCDATQMMRVGKKAAGRTLDGRTWDEYPEARS